MTSDKTPTDAIEPCPFCNGRAQLNPVARDWWRIVIDHEEYCALSGHYDDVIVPQDDESRAWLIDRWNTRANCGSPVVAGEPVAVIEFTDGVKEPRIVAAARARLLEADLAKLTERGAVAWPGIDAQDLRDGSKP